MSVAVISRDNICHACLSTERSLTPINRFGETLFKLLAPELDLRLIYLYKEPLFCWECSKVIQNVDEFRQQVYKAQVTLCQELNEFNNDQKITIAPLSKLQAYSKNFYDHEFYEEPSLQNVKDEIKDDLECVLEAGNVKTELNNGLSNVKHDATSDNDLDYDTHMLFEETAPTKEKKSKSVKRKTRQEKSNHVKKKKLKAEPITPDIKIKVEANYDDIKDPDFDIPLHELREKKKSAFAKRHIRRYKILDTRVNAPEQAMNKIIISKDELQDWMEDNKTKDVYAKMKYKCEKCIVAFNCESLIARHMRVHSKERGPYQCEICERRFDKRNKMAVHHKEHYTRYECTLCGQKFHKHLHIYRHIRRYHGRKVRCLECGQEFNHMYDFNKHYKSTHQTFICDYCGKTYHCFKDQFIKHIKRHSSRFNCTHCPRSFISDTFLQQHITLEHSRSAVERSYCVECNIQFSSSDKYKCHVNYTLRHGRRSDDFPCPDCGKILKKKSNLDAHIRAQHLRKSPHYCAQCDKYFPYKNNLRVHIDKVHLKIQAPKNKMCNICHRTFSTNRILRHHIRVHTGEKPYKCSLCPASYSQQWPLVKHVENVHHMKISVPPSPGNNANNDDD